MTFSEKLMRLRKREGLSQEELAAYLEVSRQAVSRWEQGTAHPPASCLRQKRHRPCRNLRGMTGEDLFGHGRFLWEYPDWDCCSLVFFLPFSRRNM